MIKLDLHTHSIASPDGSLTADMYQRMITTGKLSVIAVTDHDTIEFAQKLQSEMGQRVIVGEEITSQEGEIIGLFLRERVPPGLSAMETVRQIHTQGGLVYIPHPFETVRKGLSRQTLDSIAGEIDIIETGNGRAVFQDKSHESQAWAAEHSIAHAASSDAHGWHGWGRTYSVINEQPTRETLRNQLSGALLVPGKVGARGVLYPKFNRLRGKLSKDPPA